MQTLRVLSLRKDEIEFLGMSARCETCGHLDALHNEHCCAFCQVPGCRCHWDSWDTEGSLAEPLFDGGGYLDAPVIDAPLCELFAEVVV